jgi:hypothetical protein
MMSAHVPKRNFTRRNLFACAVLTVAIAVAASCHHAPPLDTKPLDGVGLNYSSIVELKALNITNAEILEIAKARQGGLSEPGCIEVLQIFRQRGEPFTAGDVVAGMIQAGMSEGTTMQLAKMNQLGLSAGELQAMRLAGLSDAIVIEVARHRAGGAPVLSGASLAGMKNVGVRNSTLLEFARRGIPDSQASAILTSRRHGASDAELLRRFSVS